MIRILLLTGGILHIINALFHIGFWRIFNWGEELSRLSINNRGIMQTLNICLIYFFFSIAVYSFYLSQQLSFSGLDKGLLLFIAGLYVLRAILEFPLFGYSKAGVFLFIFCLALAACYVVPLFYQGDQVQAQQRELSYHLLEVARLVNKEC